MIETTKVSYSRIIKLIDNYDRNTSEQYKTSNKTFELCNKKKQFTYENNSSSGVSINNVYVYSRNYIKICAKFTNINIFPNIV